MAIGVKEFEFVRELVSSRAGVVLKEKERFLAEARLTPMAKLEKAGSVADFINSLQSEDNDGLHDQVLDALLPKETSFFRDGHPFELLRTDILRILEMRRSHERRLRIWSAGCSSGQEAYSVAMVIGRYFSQLLKWDTEIYGTDLSKDALKTAEQGTYNRIETNRGVAPSYLKEFFRPEKKSSFIIKDPIRKIVCFEELNLADEWPQLEQLDIILMRNVISFLKPEVRTKVLANVKQILKPDGYLLLGTRELIDEATTGLRMVPAEKAVYYQHVDSA